jgi:DNA invertase Pin-like site-specific DNA recombinase
MAFVKPLEISNTPGARRGAQYVRVSTDQQRYSIENQAAAIAPYAVRRNISIVRTYSDQGRSGVRIVGRDGLQQLIQDVQRERADFDCILVYDVSRWGRFQDVDESAYYEFICKRAGINVHYCADEFENDGSLASIVLKNIKRVAAADYSRQLSKKVFLGQCRVATLGRWRGGPAGYGLRRMLVGENGKPKMLLKYGQRKSLKTEHVVLVSGPKSEIRIVRHIFTSFANQKKTRTEIANELNAKGIRNACGKPWSMLTVSNMLKNEIYLGNIIYNRRSQKLGEKQVANPRDMWIRCNNALKPIISPKLFAKAQTVLVELERGRTSSDKELLDDLAALLRKRGHLSMKIMQSARGLPHWSVYARRFGSVMNAYKRIGFKPKNRYSFAEIAASIDTTIREVASHIITAMDKRRTSVTFLPELYLLTINRGLTVGMAVARSVANGTGVGPSRRWEVRKLKYRKSDLTLVVRMDSSNTKIKDYFLMPTANLPRSRDNRMRISSRNFGEFAYGDLNAILRALTDWLSAGSIVRRPN